MNQAPKKTTVWQLAYEPLPWVYWVRIVQLVFNVIVLALVAYAASQSIVGSHMPNSSIVLTKSRSVQASISLYSRYVSCYLLTLHDHSNIISQTVWSILWIPLITWGTSYIQARHQPNFAVLAIEALTCLWWLVAFAMLASIASGKAFFTGVAGISYSYKLMKRSPYTTYDASSSTTDSSDYDDLISSVASSLTSSSSDSISESLNLPNWAGAVNACKGATAVAALNW